jgi:hypothetical protein
LHCATKRLPLHAMAECQKGQQQLTQDDNKRSSVKHRADLNQGEVLVMMVGSGSDVACSAQDIGFKSIAVPARHTTQDSLSCFSTIVSLPPSGGRNNSLCLQSSPTCLICSMPSCLCRQINWISAGRLNEHSPSIA